jgi:hypothetical protein
MRKVEIEILDYENNVLGKLDLTNSENFPLSMTYSVSDGRDLESRFGDYSKTFKIPSTKNNNKLLNSIHNPLVKNDKDMFGLKDCNIIVDGLIFLSGKIRIQGGTLSDKPLDYSCIVYGSNYDWMSSVKKLNMCDLFDDSFTFDYEYQDIINSWTNGNASEIVYPLISYGDFYPEGPQSQVNFRDIDNPSQDMRPSFFIYQLIQKIFNNAGYKVESSFMDNANFKNLIANFPLSPSVTRDGGEFLATRNYWNYQDSSSSTSQKAIWDSSLTPDYQVIATSSQYAADVNVDTGWHTLKNNIEIKDTDSNYDTSTGEWTCQKSGLYNFNAASQLIMGDFDDSQVVAEKRGGGTWTTQLRIIREDSSGNELHTVDVTRTSSNTLVGHYLSETVYYTGYGDRPLLLMHKHSIETPDPIYVNVGDVVKTQVRVQLNVTSVQADATWGIIALSDELRKSYSGGEEYDIKYDNGINYTTKYNVYASGNFKDENAIKQWEQGEKPFFKGESVGEGLFIGNTYKYNEILPCDISQIDFIKGVAHLYNLQFRTDSQSKTVYIEPYDTFYKDVSESIDWSDLIDRSKVIEDKYEIGLKDKISFEYKKDGSDGLMKYLNETFRNEQDEPNFFDYFESIGDSYPKGIKKFINPLFAPTWSDWDADISANSGANPAQIPIINKTESVFGYGVEAHPVRPEKTFKHAPRVMSWKGYVTNPNHSVFPTVWRRKTSAGTVSSANTPRATFVDWEDNSGNEFTNLSYADETIQPPYDSTETVVEGLYSKYWKKMIEQLKDNPRIRNVYVKLKIKDIMTLDLSKLVNIDGVYWRINKIVDFNPLKNGVTKVELIQWTQK